MEKTLRRTLTKTTLHATIWQERLIILMVCSMSQVQQMTRSPFSEKQSYQIMTERGGGGRNARLAWLLGRANVISSRSFIRSAMFDLELEWTVGVRGGGRAGRPLPEENVEKQNTHWLVVPHCISDNEQVTNQNELNYQLEVRETARQSFFSQERDGFDKTSSASQT